MGFCFFTENTTLNIHSLGLNVGQLVHCICIGGGGGGGGGAGNMGIWYCNRVNRTSFPANEPQNGNGENGGTGGITSFGSYVSARGGLGGAGGTSYLGYYSNSQCYGVVLSTTAAGGGSYMEGSNGGAGCGNSNRQRNNSTGTSSSYNYCYHDIPYSATGGGGGGAGEYVYKSFVLNEELIPITIGDRGKGGNGGTGYVYNTWYMPNNGYYTKTVTSQGNAGGDAGCGGKPGAGTTGGGGGSGFGSGGGGGGGVASAYYTTNGYIYYNGGGGGGAGGYFIGEQRVYSKAGINATTTVGGSSGLSLDYSTLYPRVAAGQNGRSYPVLNKAGSGVCILMW